MQRAAWISRLPAVDGELLFNEPLAPLTWFRTGGAADALLRPASVPELVKVITAIPADVPIHLVGLGSNLLVRDGGVEGLVIKLPKAIFGGIRIDGTTVHVGAAAIDIAVANAAQVAGLAGLEFLRGIPGAIGGAIAMNAGAYGGEVADVLVEATAVNRAGDIKTFNKDQLKFAYRTCGLEPGWIFLSAVLEGRPGDPTEIKARMDEIARAREDSQPLRTRTGGSTFKNPPLETSGGRKAWQLIDEAGCRGLTIGNAQMSEKHCNFLLNLGGALSADIEALIHTVQARVKAVTGVDLHAEIRVIGRETPHAL